MRFRIVSHSLWMAAVILPAAADTSPALFEKGSPVGPSVGQTPGSYGFYFTPNQDVRVAALGAFNYSSYSSGSALVEVWMQGAVSPETSAIVPLGGTGTDEGSFDYTFTTLAGPAQATLTAGTHYILIWKDNQGTAVQPFADGVHAVVNGPIAQYDVPTSTPGLLTLNYSYSFILPTSPPPSLIGINPWDEQHVNGWSKSIINGDPTEMSVNIEVVALPELPGTGLLVAAALGGLAIIRRFARK